MDTGIDLRFAGDPGAQRGHALHTNAHRLTVNRVAVCRRPAHTAGIARAVAPDRGILTTLAPATPNDGITAEALARAVTLVGDDQHVGCGRACLIEACGQTRRVDVAENHVRAVRHWCLLKRIGVSANKSILYVAFELSARKSGSLRRFRLRYRGRRAVHSAGTSTYDPSRSATDAQPSSFIVRTTSLRRISIARATPSSPAAARP